MVKGYIACCALITAATIGPVHSPEFASEHRLLLTEAYRLADFALPRWEGWPQAPSPILLVDGETEYLIGHPQPTSEFTRLDIEPIAGRQVFARDRVFAANLLATFPAVGGVPTIVIGTPGATGLTPTRWALTVVHEHFHQLQMSQPGYYASVNALDLSGGDETGMWMLEYPFPYASVSEAAAIDRLGAMARSLADEVRQGAATDAALAAYLGQRTVVQGLLTPADFRYLSFQVWQEGLARYAELDVARAAVDGFELSQEFRTLSGYAPLLEVAEDLWEGCRAAADTGIAEAGRLYFYSLGCLEGAILDGLRPGWRDRYLPEPFAVHAYFE